MTTGPSILLDWIEKDYKNYVEAFFSSRLSDTTLSDNQQKEMKKGEKLFFRPLGSNSTPKR